MSPLFWNGPALQGTRSFGDALGRCRSPEEYFRPGATGYDIQHELFHASHARTIGYEKYVKLTPPEREQFVFDQMIKPKIWDQLTAPERQNAIDYQYYKYPGGNLRGHKPSPKDPIK